MKAALQKKIESLVQLIDDMDAIAYDARHGYLVYVTHRTQRLEHQTSRFVAGAHTEDTSAVPAKSLAEIQALAKDILADVESPFK